MRATIGPPRRIELAEPIKITFPSFAFPMESADIPFMVTIQYIPQSSEEREAFSINFEGFVWRVRSLCAQNINMRETIVSSNQEVILFESLHDPVNVPGIKEINNLLNDIHPQYGEEGGEEDVVVKI